MARILVTSGPTRQYLDPVRFISNGSTGTMGSSIVDAAIEAGHEVIVVSGPVAISYHAQATTVDVQTTSEMLSACQLHFETCDALIAAAAPCDFQPRSVAENKMKKTGEGMSVELAPTPDVLATLSKQKRNDQLTIGFALESENERENALAKMERKNCDWIVLNRPEAIGASESYVEILDRDGVTWSGTAPKQEIAKRLIRLVTEK